jgi:hypothetical protein
MDVRPLTPERFGDLAALFEENGDPKWCWCCWQVGEIWADGCARVIDQGQGRVQSALMILQPSSVRIRCRYST